MITTDVSWGDTQLTWFFLACDIATIDTVLDANLDELSSMLSLLLFAVRDLEYEARLLLCSLYSVYVCVLHISVFCINFYICSWYMVCRLSIYCYRNLRIDSRNSDYKYSVIWLCIYAHNERCSPHYKLRFRRRGLKSIWRFIIGLFNNWS